MRAEAKVAIIICLTFVAIWAVINLAVNRTNIVVSNWGQGESPPEPIDQPTPSDEGINFPLVIYLMYFFIWLCIGLLVAYVVWAIITKNRKALKKMVILLVIFMGSLFVLLSSIDWLRELFKKHFSFVRPAGSHGSGQTSGIAVILAPVIAVAIIIFWLVLVVFIIFMIRRNTKGKEKKKSSKKEAADAIGRAIRELRSGGEFRVAILRCYRRFCKLVGERGMSEQDALTPKELEILVMEKFSLPTQPLEILTSLFEEARYSTHDIDADMKTRAIRCLISIKKSLDEGIDKEAMKSV